ncbi:MAG: iron chaperone [Chloroflexota bacterium]|jgi:hypothetical protein
MADKSATAAKKKATTFTEDEKDAMRERAKEAKAQSRRDPEAARIEGERDVLAKIADMPGPDRVIAERLHALVTETAPDLVPRTYYGMPAYSKNGKVVCFFKPASKFGARYATLGFEDAAMIDEGEMFPTSFGIKELVPADEARIVDLVRKAVS